MGSENKFWIVVWLIVAAVIISFIGAMAAYSINVTNKVSQAIANGVDPIAAMCALNRPEGSGNLLCVKR